MTTMRSPNNSHFGGVLVILLLVAGAALAGAHFGNGVLPAAKPLAKIDAEAEIVGPESIEYAGQFARYRVTVTGVDPKQLIDAWHVESLSGLKVPQPAFQRTENACEIELCTAVGKWKLTSYTTDPKTRICRVIAREITVPGQTAPAPAPLPANPKPDASKPAPDVEPKPLPPPPPPPGRFDQFTTDVRTWGLEVKSPAKADEAKALADGATAIATRCRSGDLSKHTGVYLESTVLLAVRQSNEHAIGSHLVEWRQFGTKVSSWVGQAVNTKRIADATDFADLLDAFAAGLH
jgi:hypothetical protein